MPIHGWDEGSRDWQRVGKIKLGHMVKKNGKEYPASSDKFEIPNELKAKLDKVMNIPVNGEIKELDIMLPAEGLDKIAPCHLKRYNGKNQLVCKGDGQKATVTKEHLDYIFSQNKVEYVKKSSNGQYVDPTTGTPVKTEMVGGSEVVAVKCGYKNCSFYDKKQCKEVATLNVVLYKLPELGVYSLETSSYNSYQNVKNSINMIKNAVGHVSFIPLKLRIKMEAKGEYKRKFPILYVDIDMSFEELINKYRGKKPQFEPNFQPEDDVNKPELLFGPFANQSKPDNPPKQNTTPPSGNGNANQGNIAQSNIPQQGKKLSNERTQEKPQQNQNKHPDNIGFFEVVNAKKELSNKSKRPFLRLQLKQIGGGQGAGQVITCITEKDGDVQAILGKRIVPEINVEGKFNIVKNWTVVA